MIQAQDVAEETMLEMRLYEWARWVRTAKFNRHLWYPAESTTYKMIQGIPPGIGPAPEDGNPRAESVERMMTAMAVHHPQWAHAVRLKWLDAQNNYRFKFRLLRVSRKQYQILVREGEAWLMGCLSQE